MNKSYFEILRAGVNTTLQDEGRPNVYHIGVPFSGAMDRRNYLISNSILGNNANSLSLEFAYQGPLLKLKNGKVCASITGDVIFNIIKKNSEIKKGECYKSFISVYGYLSVKGGFQGDMFWGSSSIHTKSEIGPNNGKKFSLNEKLYLNKFQQNFISKKIKYQNFKIEFIRVIKATNFDYFSDAAINNFFSKEFNVTKLTDRMGMRLEGFKIENNFETNIKSEGLVKGVIQVPPDGNPIIMLSDHGTIGGYPKIAVVVSADLDRLVQTTPGNKIKFKLIELSEAERLFKLYNFETENIINNLI